MLRGFKKAVFLVFIMKWLVFLILFLVACSPVKIPEKVEPVVKEEIKITEQAIMEEVTQNMTEQIPVVNQEIPETTNVVEQEINMTELKEKEMKYENIVAIGDSLTYGQELKNPPRDNWVALYSKKMNVTLFNYAVSGYTTYDVLSDVMPRYENRTFNGEKLTFLWIGANDVMHFIPLNEFEDNFRELVDALNDENTKLVIINIPDVSKIYTADMIQQQADEYLAQYGVKVNLKIVTKELVSQYNGVIHSIAAENNLQVIDMFNYLDLLNDEIISDDAFHPNELGHKLIAEKVEKDLN